MKNSNKTGAMEMSVGTIVTIVLLMSVLVLGIFLIQKIFKTGTSAIDSVDERIQSEIETLFGTDENAKVATIPRNRFSIKQGDTGGFALSIKNTMQTQTPETFSYEITSRGSTCGITDEQAENLIAIGRTDENLELSSGQILKGIFIRFNIPETVPLCAIDYKIVVKDSQDNVYDTIFMGAEIV